ncbi:MAG: DUF4350 domain-containing protein [Opitutaceae bacterium]
MRSHRFRLSLLLVSFVLLLALGTSQIGLAATKTARSDLVLASANLVPNPDFEDGPWRSYTRSGQARATVSEEGGYEKTSSLFLVGETTDAIIEAYSAGITVLPSSSYQLDFAYKLAYGSGTLDVRWQGGGYVISLIKPTSGWTTFVGEFNGLDRRLHGTRYTKGLGSADGREPVRDPTIAIPVGITTITIRITLRGQGSLAVDSLRLAPLNPAAPVHQAAVDRGASISAIDQDEISRLLIVEQPVPVTQAERKALSSDNKLNIRDVVLPSAYGRDPAVATWPATASNLRLRAGHFVRADAPQRPVFLMGFESTVVYPWLYKLLGADFVHFQDTCSAGVIRSNKEGDTTNVWWQNYDWLDAQLRRVLSSGLSAHVQPYEELQDVFPGKRMPFYREFPDLYVNKSHFINYRFEEPDGRRLRENMWRSYLGITRRYPIFSYELFNEVRYMDYSPANLAGFRGAMQGKYLTISRANAAWGTAFAGFGELIPPEKSNAGGGNRRGLSPRDFSIPLWVDWQKFIEKVFAGHLSELAAFIRTIDRSPDVNLTVQSTCDLNQGYSGGDGVYPPLKVLSEDFYGAEGSGGAYISQVGGDNFNEIRDMIQAGMTGKLAAFVADKKPVIDIEVNLRGYGRSPVPGTRLIDLDHQWKFRPDNARDGETLGFASTGYDDSTPEWSPINVPGLWGAQGHADCTFGWYRTTFLLPAARAGLHRPVFLNGSKLTDTATVYINGHRIHRTQSWSERFGIDISPYLHSDPAAPNTLVVSVENNYRDGGMYWGGIRDYLSIDDRPYSSLVPVTAGQMRSFLWQKITHGADGLVPSYAYTPEGDHLSIFNPEKVTAAALLAMPLIKREISNVGDLVLSQNRRLEPIGLLYSFESGRARVPANYEDWIKAPAAKDLTTWYGALRFANMPLNMIYNDALLGGRCDAQRVIILRMCERLADGTLAKLEAFARAGGTVLIDYGSAVTNDDTHAPLDLRSLAGIEVGESRLDPAVVRPGRLSEAAVRTAPRLSDRHTGRHINIVPSIVPAATAELSYEDGSPALTRRAVGLGAIYYLAAELPFDSLQTLLSNLCRESLAADPSAIGITVTRAPGSENGRYVEADLFTDPATRTSLAYLHNWGDDADVTVHLPSLPAGRWRVRQLDPSIPAPEESIHTARELHSGLALRAPCQNPVILLVEPADAPARRLSALSDRHLAQLDELMSPSAGSSASGTPPRILFNASRAETMSPVRMLTAMRLLRAAGYGHAVNLKDIAAEVSTYSATFEKEKLSDYAVFATLGSATGKRRFTPAEIDTLRDYVANGGGLLVAANQYVGPHGWLENNSGKGPLVGVFDCGVTNTNIDDPAHAVDGIAMHPVLVPAPSGSSHPLLIGVAQVKTLGMSVINPGPKATVVLRSTDMATPPNAPAVAALEYGKGRVVFLGDAKWMQPETLAQGDNARFLLNIINWLARREGPALSDADVARLADARLD